MALACNPFATLHQSMDFGLEDRMENLENDQLLFFYFQNGRAKVVINRSWTKLERFKYLERVAGMERWASSA